VSWESAATINDERGTYPPVEAPIRQLPELVGPVCALTTVAAIIAPVTSPSARRAVAITFIDSRLMVMVIS
jgi:hypothetical protein